MASNTSLNNNNNVQHPQTSFITPISLSSNNAVNSINIDTENEIKENQYSNPVLNKENQQQQQQQIQSQQNPQQQYVNYNISNNYVQDTNNIKLTTRKRHLSSSSNTSISSHTLINNNYDENHFPNNPNMGSAHYKIQRNSYKPMTMMTETTTFTSTTETTIAATQNHSINGHILNNQINNSNNPRNINNGIPISLFNNSQNPSEKMYAQNKNKKQKIEFNNQIQQKHSLTQTIEKTIHHNQINDQTIKRTHQERVDSFSNNNMNNENNNMNNKEFDIPNTMNYIYTREVQPSLIQNPNQPFNVSK